MFFSDAGPDESPDLELWAELLEPEDVEELRVLSAELRVAEADEAFRTAASSLGIPYKGGTPAYHKAYNALKKQAKDAGLPLSQVSWSTHAPSGFAPPATPSAVNPSSPPSAAAPAPFVGGFGAGTQAVPTPAASMAPAGGAGPSSLNGPTFHAHTPGVTKIGTFLLAPGVSKLPGQAPLKGNIPVGAKITSITPVTSVNAPFGGATAAPPGTVKVEYTKNGVPGTSILKPQTSAPAGPAAVAPSVPAGSVPFDASKLPVGATVTAVGTSYNGKNTVQIQFANGDTGTLYVPTKVAVPTVGTKNAPPAGTVVSPYGGGHTESVTKPVAQANWDASKGVLSGTEKAALKAYTGESYQSINGSIHNGSYDAWVAAGKPPATAKNSFAYIENLNSAFSKAKPFSKPIDVFRGSSHNPVPAGAKPGDTFAMRGFSSTSIRESGTFGSAHFIHVKTTKGLYIRPISKHPGEDEVLLPHNVKVRFLGVERRIMGQGQTKDVIMLETFD